MKPVAVLQYAEADGPGHCATYLDSRRTPWRLIRVHAGDPVPLRADAFRGIVLLGGPMSVNDDLPWMGRVLQLIRDAAGCGVPLLGHCLGGQLMSKAMGGVVTRNRVKEIGWGEVDVVPGSDAGQWFGAHRRLQVFQWHGETFSIPPGATRVLTGDLCPNQGFVLGPHLALQCHKIGRAHV